MLPDTSVRARMRVPRRSPHRRRESAVFPEMVLLVMVRVPVVRHTAAAVVGGIPRDGAIGHGEGAVVHAPPPPWPELPEMVLLVMVRVP